MGERLRSRFRRAQVLKRVLTPYGLEAHDDGQVPGIQLATRTGDHVLLGNLEELWIAAEKMCGKTIDPLAPCFTG
jgi:hypothetical protein